MAYTTDKGTDWLLKNHRDIARKAKARKGRSEGA